MFELVLYAFFFAQAALNMVYLVRLMMRESGMVPAALTKANRRPEPPSITYVRPMKGLDETTEACLRSLYMSHSIGQQRASVIYSFESRDDPAVAVVERVAEHLSERLPSQIVFSTIEAANPKMGNCVEAYERATTEWVALLDANVDVPLGFIKEFERYCVPSVRAASGYIHGVLASSDASATLEYATLYSFFGKGTLLAETFGQAPLIGKAMLVHKPTLDGHGGLRRYKDTFSEDGEIGLELARHYGQLAVPVMHVEAPQRISATSIEAVTNRFARWGLYRKRRAPWLFWLEPLLYPLSITLLCVFFARTALERLFFLSVHAAFVCVEAHFAHRAQHAHAPVQLGYAEVLGAIVRSNVLLIAVWADTARMSSVSWKGKTYAVNSNGDMVVHQGK